MALTRPLQGNHVKLMSVFHMDGMELALDGMVPAPAAKVGIENEINYAQGAQNRKGPVVR
jgi:hypothetical protein